MPDWTASMQQTFEYYIVNPGTWADEKKLDMVKSSTINRESDSETLGSASFDVTDSVGECYIRVYLVTIQNGVQERHPLGTFLVQTPSSSFNGKVRSVSMDAYTPLLELKEKSPPIGYALFKGQNIMDSVYALTKENVRAPVIEANSSKKLEHDFVSDPNEKWITFLIDLMANADYVFELDELGNVLFAPKKDTAALQPVWTYDDGNSSILYPELSVNHDLYGIPNVVEVVHSNGNTTFYSRAVNKDENSPISTVNRGREIVHRVTDANIATAAKKEEVDEYAKQVLRDMSTLEYTISYTHGYCPVRVGDCVRLNYTRAGLTNIKARVISQSISCVPGCPVTEKAVFTTKLWG